MKVKQLMNCISTAALAALALSGAAYASETAGGQILEIAEYNSFVYVPEGIEQKSIITPILLVYGDEDYTAETALTEVQDSGFAQIAAENNMVVTLVNSVGDTWGSEDTDNYIGIVGSLYIERPESIDENGQDPDGKFQGYAHRVYVAGEGSGADFITEYLVNDELTEYVEAWDATMDRMPACVMLFNGTVLPSDGLEMEYPAVVVNGSEELNSAYQALNGSEEHFLSVSADTAEGFDAETVSRGFHDVAKTVRRTQLTLDNCAILNVPDYNALGIQVTEKTVQVSTGTEVTYIEYLPDTVDTTAEGSVPLVMTFHGGGENAEYFSALSTWPVTAKENGLINVSFDQHNNYTNAEVVEVLTMLEEEYPCIDTTRIYASGFSMGSGKTQSLAYEYPELLAGIAPIDGMNMTSYLEKNIIMPIMYIAGEKDPYPTIFPAAERLTSNITLEHLFDKNGLGDYVYDTNAQNTYFGIDAEDTEEIAGSAGSSVMTVSRLKSEDGNVYTALVSTSDMGHTIFVDYPDLAWNFLKNFSRAEDGSIICTAD